MLQQAGGMRSDGEQEAARQAAEFGTVATWTADAVRALGPEFALPGTCRGTGGPAALGWLTEALAPQSGTVLLDVGAGMGGPAAFVRERTGVLPLLVDPLESPNVVAREVFGLPGVRALGEQLPFPDNTFRAAWCLGTLCTTARQSVLLGELARVLRPGSRTALMVVVTTGDVVVSAPTGNVFATREVVDRMLSDNGMVLTGTAWVDELPGPDVPWTQRGEAVASLVRERHGGQPAHEAAERQERYFAARLRDGRLRRYLVAAQVG